MNKKEDFLKHELKIFHKRDNKSNEIKEEKIKIQKHKIKKRSESLKKVLISFLKENDKESYTANTIKTKLNCRIRFKSLKEEISNLASEEILKCKPDEIAELDMEDVSPEDKSLVAEGAVFYWSVGYYMENRQIIKQSDIRFQRLIPIDDDEFEDAMQKVELKLSKLIKKTN